MEGQGELNSNLFNGVSTFWKENDGGGEEWVELGQGNETLQKAGWFVCSLSEFVNQGSTKLCSFLPTEAESWGASIFRCWMNVQFWQSWVFLGVCSTGCDLPGMQSHAVRNQVSVLFKFMSWGWEEDLEEAASIWSRKNSLPWENTAQRRMWDGI